MEDLDVNLRNELDLLFRNARTKVNVGESGEGIHLAESAWKQLPEPKFGWDVSKSYTHALALIYRDTGKYAEALALMNQLFGSGTVKAHQDQPYYVTGTIYFEMNDMENARKWLKEADRISKGRCFQEQPEKYKAAIKK